MIHKTGRSLRAVSTIGGAVLAMGLCTAAHADETQPIAGVVIQSLDEVSAPQAPGGGRTCIADWGGDGQVSILDFLSFIGDWNRADPETDLWTDGEINILDVVAFMIEFNKGC